MTAYVIHDGEMVSRPWKTVLVEMEKHSPNNVNEGHRTMARQTWFWNCWRCQCCNNGNLAAFPSPFAPHIRTGRIDHAIDFSDGAAAERWLDSHGVQAWRTVPGESWHLEADAGDLKRFHRTHGNQKWEALPKHLQVAVKRFFGARNLVKRRVKDRDRINSKTDPDGWMRKDELVDRAVRARSKRRGRLERALKRARRDRTKRLLREALK
jgi:hypothetical protein